MRNLTPLAEGISEIASDAMSDAMDMDVGIGQLAAAASIAVLAEFADEMKAELERICALIGRDASATISIATDRLLAENLVSIILRPSKTAPSTTIFAPTIPEALKLAEEYATTYAADHRVMSAGDLGIAA